MDLHQIIKEKQLKSYSNLIELIQNKLKEISKDEIKINDFIENGLKLSFISKSRIVSDIKFDSFYDFGVLDESKFNESSAIMNIKNSFDCYLFVLKFEFKETDATTYFNYIIKSK